MGDGRSVGAGRGGLPRPLFGRKLVCRAIPEIESGFPSGKFRHPLMAPAGRFPITYNAMAPANDMRDLPVTPQRAGASDAPVHVQHRAVGVIDWLFRVPLSGKLLGANFLVAMIALASLFFARIGGETLTESLVVSVAAVVFSIAANIALVSVALRPLREL